MEDDFGDFEEAVPENEVSSQQKNQENNDDQIQESKKEENNNFNSEINVEILKNQIFQTNEKNKFLFEENSKENSNFNIHIENKLEEKKNENFSGENNNNIDNTININQFETQIKKDKIFEDSEEIKEMQKKNNSFQEEKNQKIFNSKKNNEEIEENLFDLNENQEKIKDILLINENNFVDLEKKENYEYLNNDQTDENEKIFKICEDLVQELFHKIADLSLITNQDYPNSNKIMIENENGQFKQNINEINIKNSLIEKNEEKIENIEVNIAKINKKNEEILTDENTKVIILEINKENEEISNENKLIENNDDDDFGYFESAEDQNKNEITEAKINSFPIENHIFEENSKENKLNEIDKVYIDNTDKNKINENISLHKNDFFEEIPQENKLMNSKNNENETNSLENQIIEKKTIDYVGDVTINDEKQEELFKKEEKIQINEEENDDFGGFEAAEELKFDEEKRIDNEIKKSHISDDLFSNTNNLPINSVNFDLFSVQNASNPSLVQKNNENNTNQSNLFENKSNFDFPAFQIPKTTNNNNDNISTAFNFEIPNSNSNTKEDDLDFLDEIPSKTNQKRDDFDDLMFESEKKPLDFSLYGRKTVNIESLLPQMLVIFGSKVDTRKKEEQKTDFQTDFFNKASTIIEENQINNFFEPELRIFIDENCKIKGNTTRENLSNNSRLQMTTLIKDLNFIWNNSNYNKILKEKLDIKFSENEEETISEKKKPKKPIMSIKIEAKNSPILEKKVNLNIDSNCSPLIQTSLLKDINQEKKPKLTATLSLAFEKPHKNDVKHTKEPDSPNSAPDNDEVSNQKIKKQISFVDKTKNHENEKNEQRVQKLVDSLPNYEWIFTNQIAGKT